MVNRILIAPEGVKLSKVGQDVLVTPDENLLFNGSYAGAAKFIKGSVAGSRGGNGATTHVVNYGKTFTTQPLVMSSLVAELPQRVPGNQSNGTSFPGNAYPVKGYGDSSTPYSDFAFSWTQFQVRVSLSSVEFIIRSAASSFNYTVHYMILDYRTGF